LLLRYQMTDRIAHSSACAWHHARSPRLPTCCGDPAHRAREPYHAHAASHAFARRRGWWATLLVGMVHGLAGSAPLLLLTLTVVSRRGSLLLHRGVRGRFDHGYGDHELAARCARSPHRGRTFARTNLACAVSPGCSASALGLFIVYENAVLNRLVA
jgi:hypothetical protein